MREVLTMSEKQMPEWRAICRAFAKRENAKLLFVNETSMGIEYQNGTMRHISIEELLEILSKEQEYEN